MFQNWRRLLWFKRSVRRPYVRPEKRSRPRLEQLEDRATPSANFVPNELLVKFRPDATLAQRAAVIQAVSGLSSTTIHTAAMRHFGQGVIEQIKLPDEISVNQAVALAKNMPKVEFAEPNYLLTIGAVSNDPYYTAGGDSLWGMYSSDSPRNVGPSGTTNVYGSQAEQAWFDGRIGSRSVYVGVIDSGVQVTHPDLINNVFVNPFDPPDGIDNDGNGYIDDIHGWDFVNNDNSVYDGLQDDHGTHVAGTIGAEGGNGIGVAGVNWHVTIISGKFLDGSSGSIAGAVQAVDYMTDLKIRHGLNIVVTNNSYGGSGISTAFHEAVLRHAKAGILFVAAAGNESSNNDATPFYPANLSTLVGTPGEPAADYEAVVSVASIDSDGSLSGFSNYGAKTVDLAAPGGNINSTFPDATYSSSSGTSMAAPHVAGAIALHASAYPWGKANDRAEAIINHAVATPSLFGKVATGGRLDIVELLRRVPIGPPVITSLNISPTPVTEGEIATLTGTFTDPDNDNDPFRVVIDWGDGSENTTLTLAPGIRSFSATHRFLDDSGDGGPLVITVRVIDVTGGEGVATLPVSGYNVPPTVSITGVPSGVVLEGKGFSLGSLVQDTSPLDTFEYEWKVYQGTTPIFTADTAGLLFTPPDQGVYEVHLKVTDDDGGVGYASPVKITAINRAPSATKLTNNGHKKPGETLTLAFTGVFDADGDLPTLQYDWDFDGNGTWDATTTTSSTTTTYAGEGFFVARGRIRDKDGGISGVYLTDVLITNGPGGHGGNVETFVIAAGSDTSRPGPVTPTSHLTVFNLDGTVRFNMQPFGVGFTGGIRTATGDVNGDRTQDIIVGPGPGGGSRVMVLSGTDGSVLYDFGSVYAPTFNRGVFVASGDFNRDGYDDFVVAPGPGQAAPVIGFSGFDGSELFRFHPFGAAYKGGVTVAIGDVNGDRRPDLIVGQNSNGGQVRAYAYTTKLSTVPFRNFTAMPPTHRGGVHVAAGDLNGDGFAEIIAGSNTTFGRTSIISVFDGKTNKKVRDFTPFASYRMGFRVGTQDLDNDGKADLLIAPVRPMTITGPNPRVYGYNGMTMKLLFHQELEQWAFQGGVFVG